MIAANCTITSYRLVTASNKDSYSGTPTLNGVPVSIARETLEKASFIDQDNALYIFTMESDEDLDIVESDKVVDSQPTPATYIVQNVIKEPRDFGVGTRTFCYLKKKR